MCTCRSLTSVSGWIVVAALISASAQAQAPLRLDRPGEREFVQDHSRLLTEEQARRVQQIAESLLNDTAVPLFVVTIERKVDYGGQGLPLERFARLLYDQWGIGHMRLGDREFNRGMLLLVIRGDREARIELGGGYGSRMDEQAQWIMDNRIVPRFRAADYGSGIVDAVEAMDLMARGELRTSGWAATYRPWWHFAIAVAAILLAGFTGVSLRRRGRHGLAWAFWALALGGTWWLLREVGRNRRGRGGFGGGGFGGGRSGGGGASGRW